MKNKPIIGISGSIIIDSGVPFPGYHRSYVNDDYIDSVIQAGGIPFIIPFNTDKKVIADQIDQVDGLILSGGHDVDPLNYNEEPRQKLTATFPERDTFDFTLIKFAEEKQIPILGICRGAQILNVYHGGTIVQDLSYADHELLRHAQPASPTTTTHSVSVKENTIFSKLFNEHRFTVNSFHHQVLGKLADNFEVGLVAPDGVIEGFQNTTYSNLEFAVQFHPEMLHRISPIAQTIFKTIVNQAKES